MIEADELASFVTALFVEAGTPEDISSVCSEHLVRANLSGYDSHGVIHVPHYLEELRKGWVDPAGRPEVIGGRTAVAIMDGHMGWGLYGASVAMCVAVEKAKACGVGAVSLRNYTHIGRLGHYVEQAAESSYLSFVSWGAGEASAHQAPPFGGSVPALSTNPIAFGAPTGDDRPVVVDFATTSIANAKAWEIRDRGEELPPGAAFDRHGYPTLDPSAYLDGGTLAFAGGHKGYGLSLMACLLGGLSGHLFPDVGAIEGPFFLAIDPTAFLPLGEYQAGVRAFSDRLRDMETAPGVAEVLIPGDLEHRKRRNLSLEGIEVAASTLAALNREAVRIGLDRAL